MSERTDVVIAGGGMAGASVAASLQEFGLRVLIVEPGLDPTKRLAGELIHPPGIDDLAGLGLLRAFERAGGASVHGFAVFADSRVHVLPYAAKGGDPPQGLAMEHSAIAQALASSIEQFPHVTAWRGARVTAVDTSRDDAVRVTVSHGRRETRLSAQLLIGADGSASPVRKMAGIRHEKRRVSMMLGYLVRGSALPNPGFGTVFLGGPAPALAYHVAPDTVRVMFDVPENPHGAWAPARDLAYLQAIPHPFREQLCRAMESQNGLVSANYSLVPERVVRGRIALVGDAAGCCHPLTATGLSVCTRDAVRLRDAIRASGGDLTRALRRYASVRGGPQRTRFALAEALYQVFIARTPEMRVLRQGLLHYWKYSARGRQTSMALLSTQEGRMSVLAREYAQVVGHALPALWRWDGRRDVRSLFSRGRAAFGLWRSTLRYAGEALRALAL